VGWIENGIKTTEIYFSNNNKLICRANATSAQDFQQSRNDKTHDASEGW